MAWSRNMDWSIYDHIPDNIQKMYLEKMQLEKKEPSISYLNELTKRHQTVFPYENLDVTYFNREISLIPEKMMKKILLGKRGGYCFELNGLFCILLKTLGFDAWMCPSRQLRHKEPTDVPVAHCGVLTYIDDRVWYSDVGYGGPVPSESIEVQTDGIQCISGEKFQFRHGGISSQDRVAAHQKNGWLILDRFHWKDDTEQIESVIQVLPVPHYLKDFYASNRLRSEGDSAFKNRQASLRTDSGYRNLLENTVHIHENGTDTILNFTEKELSEVLKTYFDIII